MSITEKTKLKRELAEYRLVMTWLLREIPKIRGSKAPERLAVIRRARALLGKEEK